jgi:hypothetical protein
MVVRALAAAHSRQRGTALDRQRTPGSGDLEEPLCAGRDFAPTAVPEMAAAMGPSHGGAHGNHHGKRRTRHGPPRPEHGYPWSFGEPSRWSLPRLGPPPAPFNADVPVCNPRDRPNDLRRMGRLRGAVLGGADGMETDRGAMATDRLASRFAIRGYCVRLLVPAPCRGRPVRCCYICHQCCYLCHVH